MSYCESCKKFEEKIVDGKFGMWFGYCLQFKVGRSIDSDICNRYKEKDGIEKVIVHRAEIRHEKVDERFE